MPEVKKIEELTNQITTLQNRVQYLQGLLDTAGIAYDNVVKTLKEDDTLSIAITNTKYKEQGERIQTEAITAKHANFFYSYFRGRQDVYSKRSGKLNKKTGKHGYYTQCWNFWKDGVCPKKNGIKIKCGDCRNQRYKELKGIDIINHLKGEQIDCSDVVGLYAMFPDETCNFLVFDFDNHDEKNNGDDFANIDNTWIEDVNAMREICRMNEIDALVERSRSGKGAHVWIFFEAPIPASVARKFGSALLTKGAETVNQKTFTSYDRMVPTQDHMPEGGLGNLVALH